MTTVKDKNVHCVAVDGVFDDCQDIVKQLFCDTSFNNSGENGEAGGVTLGAVNSINWARILAQIVYYFYGYFRWLDLGANGLQPRKLGDELTFAVPSGNFGNALAGFYARSMGLPIKRIAVCTNDNDILHRFFSSGDYSVSGRAHATLAPAMDITKSSNFERFLFHLVDGDAARLRACMASITETGKLDLGEGDTAPLLAAAADIFVSSRTSDEGIRKVVAKVKTDFQYDICPHTACSVHAALSTFLPNPAKYGEVVCLATAHPGKFAGYDTANTSGAVPPLPAQLRGITALPRRVTAVANSATAVKDLVISTVGHRRFSNQSQVPAGDRSQSGGNSSHAPGGRVFSLAGSFVAGALLSAAVAASIVHFSRRKKV